MARYFFRLDDIAPNMNGDNFNRLILIFDKYGIKPLLAVIPDNQDKELLKYQDIPDFWRIISNLKNRGYAIAQHGYRHLYKTQNGGVLGINKKGEFSGLDFETQKQMINDGKNIIMEKIAEPEIFVAPGHSFDKNTARALVECGFNYISDGIALYPFKKWGIVWLPQILWRPRKEPFGMITVMFHPNTMTNEDFKHLEKFIEKNRDKIGDFSELADWSKKNGSFTKILTFLFNQEFKIIWRFLFWLKHGLSR